MPIYEYQCTQCQQVHEVMQKFSDAPMTECPTCKGETKKLISQSAFVLKGTGWYTTDYKKSSSAKPPVTAPANATPAPAATPASSTSNSGTSSGSGSGSSTT